MSSLISIALIPLALLSSLQPSGETPDSTEVAALVQFLDTGYDRPGTSERDLQEAYRELKQNSNDEVTPE